MPFSRRPIENGRERLVCDTEGCGNEELIVEYGPLRKPKKGGKKKGFFGRCPKCRAEHHIRYGHRN